MSHGILQSKSLKARILLPTPFQKFQTHPLKPTEAKTGFRKVNYLLPTKLGLPFILVTNLLPLTNPGLKPTIQNSILHSISYIACFSLLLDRWSNCHEFGV